MACATIQPTCWIFLYKLWWYGIWSIKSHSSRQIDQLRCLDLPMVKSTGQWEPMKSNARQLDEAIKKCRYSIYNEHILCLINGCCDFRYIGIISKGLKTGYQNDMIYP